MIPIRDTIPSRTFPAVTIALIAGNALAFIHEASLGDDLESFVHDYALVPAAFTLTPATDPLRYVPLFSSLFLHGGLLHLLGNMLYLWIFGDNVEDRLGHLRYLLFYFLCGAAAGLTHVYTNPDSTVPTVGASGAIAGVLGAYFILYPRSRIITLIPIVIIPWFVEIPAVVFLGLWFLLQLVSGGQQLFAHATSSSGVAFMAHVGGFVAGVILCFVLRRPEPRRYLDEYRPW